MRENKDSDQVVRGSYRTTALNKEVYHDIDVSYDLFERWMSSFIDKIDVDLVPGSEDFSSSYYPQQPVNSYLFPTLTSKSTLNLVTNPHRFTLGGGVDFLGTSGQNLRDIEIFSTIDD